MRKQLLPVIICTLFFFSIETLVSAKIVINEFSASSSDDWIELFNTPDATESASLANLKIRDSSQTNKKELSGELEPNGFLVVEFSNYLNKDGDTIKLIKIDTDEVLDSVSFGAEGKICIPENAETIGRSPDGTGGFVKFAGATKGASNLVSQVNCPIPTPTPAPTQAKTATPNPTQTPLPSPTQILSPTPKKTSTPKPTPEEEENTPAPQILGDSQENSPSPSPSSSPLVKSTSLIKMPPIAIVFIAGGIICMLGATGPLWINRLRQYNKNTHENAEEIDQIP